MSYPHCPYQFNPLQIDTDDDGIGDLCDSDDDNDGWLDEEDCQPLSEYIHGDALEVCDGMDNNCDGMINEGFPDNDSNCLADCVDIDFDADDVPNILDNCPYIYNTGQADTDSDLLGDACDPDQDNDGIPEPIDNCPLIKNEDQSDSNGDQIGDACEEDADGDGHPDFEDCQPLDASAYPGAEETCDWIDNNCDGNINEGHPNPGGIYNAALLNCNDFDDDLDCINDVIDNCLGIFNPSQLDRDKDNLGDACDDDIDGDGVLNELDCESYNSQVFPGAMEVCNLLDDDCDGQVDETSQVGSCENCDVCSVEL